MDSEKGLKNILGYCCKTLGKENFKGGYLRRVSYKVGYANTRAWRCNKRALI